MVCKFRAISAYFNTDENILFVCTMKPSPLLGAGHRASGPSCCRRCSSSLVNSTIARCVLRSNFANFTAISLLRSQFAFLGATLSITSSVSPITAFKSTLTSSNSGASAASICNKNHHFQLKSLQFIDNSPGYYRQKRQQEHANTPSHDQSSHPELHNF